VAWGRKSQSAQSREILPLWLLKCGLRAPEIVKIGNLSYKFAKKGYTPLKISTKFGLGEGVTGTYAPSRQILPLWLYKCGLAVRKISKIGNFLYIFAPKGYPLHQFLQNLAWGMVSQVPTITLTFPFVALKMWP